MTLFILTSTIAFGFLGIVWRAKEWYNALIKGFFYGLTVWGVVLIVIIFG